MTATLTPNPAPPPTPAARANHVTPTIGQHLRSLLKVASAKLRIKVDFYEDDIAVDGAMDPLAEALMLDRHPVRDWQPGDQAMIHNATGHYIVDVVEVVHDLEHVAVPAARCRIARVLDAAPVCGLDRLAEGTWPLTALQLIVED